MHKWFRVGLRNLLYSWVRPQLILVKTAQFNWEDVKEDKQGQNYLGHSVQAAHGRSRASTRFLSLRHSLLFHWHAHGRLRLFCYQSRITSSFLIGGKRTKTSTGRGKNRNSTSRQRTRRSCRWQKSVTPISWLRCCEHPPSPALPLPLAFIHFQILFARRLHA